MSSVASRFDFGGRGADAASWRASPDKAPPDAARKAAAPPDQGKAAEAAATAAKAQDKEKVQAVKARAGTDVAARASNLLGDAWAEAVKREHKSRTAEAAASAAADSLAMGAAADKAYESAQRALRDARDAHASAEEVQKKLKAFEAAREAVDRAYAEPGKPAVDSGEQATKAKLKPSKTSAGASQVAAAKAVAAMKTGDTQKQEKRAAAAERAKGAAAAAAEATRAAASAAHAALEAALQAPGGDSGRAVAAAAIRWLGLAAPEAAAALSSDRQLAKAPGKQPAAVQLYRSPAAADEPTTSTAVLSFASDAKRLGLETQARRLLARLEAAGVPDWRPAAAAAALRLAGAGDEWAMARLCEPEWFASPLALQAPPSKDDKPPHPIAGDTPLLAALRGGHAGAAAMLLDFGVRCIGVACIGPR